MTDLTGICCFCERPIAPRFDFCRECKATYDATLGSGWTDSDWYKETVRMSRHLHALRRRDAQMDTTSLDDLPADLDALDVALVQPLPQPIDMITELMVAALIEMPDAGWRLLQRQLHARGVAATPKQVRVRLTKLRAEQVGPARPLEVGG